MRTVVVLDFETTGLSPHKGDRATEIAAVLLRDGQVLDRYESLMNSGRSIPAHLVRLTGISNEMIGTAPPASKVMREAAKFVGKNPVVAHNASFDSMFWRSELGLLGMTTDTAFECTMQMSRLAYPHAPNYKLLTLAEMLRLPKSGRAHRAMADAELTSHLWLRLQVDLVQSQRSTQSF
jgi:DNA polymerase-3 subunit epsilon